MWPYPSRSVRLFVQNVPCGTSQRALRRHFEAVTGPGDVLDVSLRTFCATVRMRDEAAGQRARRELHGREFRGLRLCVHRFRGIKIYVGGLPEDCTAEDLLPLFQSFGLVSDCDVVRDYGFVHMDNEEDGKKAIENLNGVELNGSNIVVQRSVKDHKPEEEETSVEGDTFDGDQPTVSFEELMQLMQAGADQNGPESEDSSPEASRGHTHSSRSSPYERVRLSPRRSSYDDVYRDKHAGSKRYGRLSPPHRSRDDFDRRGNGSSRRYTERSESASRYTRRSESDFRSRERSGSASRHQPYERSYLSPSPRSRENYRSHH